MAAKQAYKREFNCTRELVEDALSKYLFDFQVDAVTKNVISLNKRGISVMGDTPGAGKTYIGVACAKYLGMQLFIIATKSGLGNFINVAHSMNVPVLGIGNYEMLKTGNYYTPEISEDIVGLSCKKPCPYIQIIDREVRDPFSGKIKTDKRGNPKRTVVEIQWKLPDNTLVLVDEIHKAKNGQLSGSGSLNNRLITSIRPHINTRRRLFVSLMSASIINSVDQLDTLCYMLGLVKDTGLITYRAFIQKFPPGNPLETMAKLMYPYMGSNTEKRDINLHNHVGTIMRLQITVSAEDLSVIENSNRKIVDADNPTAVTTKRGFVALVNEWQTIELTKAKYIVDPVVADYNAGKSVVIMTTFNATIQYLGDILTRHGIKYATLTGKVPEATRAESIREFQNDNLRCLLVNVKIGGTSISLHDTHGNHPRVTYLFPTMSAIDFYQALGRIDRTGTRSEVVQKIVSLANADAPLDNELINKMLANVENVYDVQGYYEQFKLTQSAEIGSQTSTSTSVANNDSI